MRFQEDEVPGAELQAAWRACRQSWKGSHSPSGGGRGTAQTTGPLGISQETALASEEDCRTIQETRRWEPGEEKSPENNGANSAKEKTRDGEGGRGADVREEVMENQHLEGPPP